jgi:hypothetical protein
VDAATPSEMILTIDGLGFEPQAACRRPRVTRASDAFGGDSTQQWGLFSHAVMWNFKI